MRQLNRKVTYKYEYRVARRTHIIATHSDSAVIPLSTYGAARGTKCSHSFGRWCVAKGSHLWSFQHNNSTRVKLLPRKTNLKNNEQKTWPKTNCWCNEYTFSDGVSSVSASSSFHHCGSENQRKTFHPKNNNIVFVLRRALLFSLLLLLSFWCD